MKQGIPKSAQAEARAYRIFFLVVFLLFIGCTLYTRFNPTEIFFKSGNFWSFIVNDFFPPKLPEAAKLNNIIASVLTTVAMAVAATTAAAIFAFLTGLFASERVSPFPRAAKYVRGIATFLRNIPTLVWAYILFSSLGIGTGVGVAALFITSYAFLVRAYAETIEDISQDCIESLRATGASFPQQVVQGTLPSCLSGFLSWYLYRIEINIRASTIVGMVGGGGVGMVLLTELKRFRYHTAFTIILLIAAMIILVDLLTGYLRKELNK